MSDAEQMHITVVIPTYWTFGQHTASYQDPVGYDHPTPLDGESTLPRLLHALVDQRVRHFQVLVLTAAVAEQLEEPAAQRVESLIRPFRARLTIGQICASDLPFLQARVGKLGFRRDILSLRGYSPIRNLQLIIPHILGSEVIVALDDDEVVGPDYLERATAHIGDQWQGASILGVAGPYLDRHGDWRLAEGEPTGNAFTDKAAVMNATVRKLMTGDLPLSPAPLAFGGNMVFHRELFTRVCFDPGVPRGEDVDYVINARMQGLRFWFNRDQIITHLPPEAYQSSSNAKLRRDVARFIYEQVKIDSAGLEPALFDPYPGRFLRPEVIGDALGVLPPEDGPERWIREIRHQARAQVTEYMRLAEEWPRLMAQVGADPGLREYWEARMRGNRDARVRDSIRTAEQT